MTYTETLVSLAQSRMPGGVSTNIRLSEGPDKLIVSRADGCRVWTTDGREFIDFVSGFGSILLGYGAAVLTECQIEALGSGIGFCGTSVTEIEAADRLVRLNPDFDMVRFCATGSEATTAAIALARAATDRRSIAVFSDHYHGWHGPTRDHAIAVDDAASTNANNADVFRLPFTDAERCEAFFGKHGRKLACVILELVMGSSGRSPSPALIDILKQARSRDGFLLIADEVITGFRVSLRGAMTRFGIAADLAVYGKCLGGGTPMGAVVGPAVLMSLFARGVAMHAGTFNGHPLSVASAVTLLDYLEHHERPFYATLNAHGEELRTGLERALARHGVDGAVRGPGPFLVLELPPFKCSIGVTPISLQEHLRYDGVRVPPGGRWFLNAAHTSVEIACAVAAVDKFLARAVADAVFS